VGNNIPAEAAWAIFWLKDHRGFPVPVGGGHGSLRRELDGSEDFRQM